MAQLRTWLRVRFGVHEEGPGIPPEFQPHLFERSVQADGTHGRHGGTGLGLNLARLTERMGA